MAAEHSKSIFVATIVMISISAAAFLLMLNSDNLVVMGNTSGIPTLVIPWKPDAEELI